ncbi:MAG: CPBP family intramembrane glutamic endopeptidase [Planctomycetota bacterium]
MPQRKREQSYTEQSRDLLNSLVLVLPLLAVYEAVLFASGTSLRNKFDFLSSIIAQMGEYGLVIFNTALMIVGGAAIAVLGRRKRLHPAVLLPMAGESLAYAAVLGSVVMFLLTFARDLLQTTAGGTDTALSVGLALGAGVYEEFAFRLVLLGLSFQFLYRVVKWPAAPALITAMLFSSVLFSLSHFDKPGLADFELNAFMFRFAAGVLLSLILYFRGFGIAVYTHALYNVLLIVGPE